VDVGEKADGARDRDTKPLKSMTRHCLKLQKSWGTLASGTIQMNHRVLKNIFSRTVEWKVIKENPVASVQKPKVISKRNIPYDEKEVMQMFRALEKEPLHWQCHLVKLKD
jgi:integrase